MPTLANNNISNQIYFQNQLLWDLGMPGKDMDNPQVNLVIKSPNLFHFLLVFHFSLQAVKTKIQQLDTQFDFVLLAEFFDESLVSLLCAYKFLLPSCLVNCNQV